MAIHFCGKSEKYLKDNHLLDNLYLPAPIFGDPSEKQFHSKYQSTKNNVLESASNMGLPPRS
jgi:hypothetical protein